MGQIKKLSTLLRKMREFYSENEWGRGALRRTDNGKYCLLGAAACVVTNKEALDTLTKGNMGQTVLVDEHAGFGHWDEIPNVKGAQILQEFEDFFVSYVEDESVENWNDRYGRTTHQVLSKLEELEEIALERGI